MSIPPDNHQSSARRLLTTVFAVAVGLGIALALPLIVSWGERSMAVLIAVVSLALLGLGLKDRMKDPDGQAGTPYFFAGSIGILLLIAVLA